MGKTDAMTYTYMSDNRRYADIFNYHLYGGRKVIKADELHELDTRELAMPYGEDGVVDTIQRYRDLLKYMRVVQDDKATYLLLGIENQSENHYAMPVRDMLYDAAQYARQITATARAHREAKDDATPAEYLSGFHKDDRLIPVVTLVLFWSPDKWNAPKSLYEMFDLGDDEMLRFVNDYKINLVSPYDMQDEDFDKLETTLAAALKYIKYSKDDEALQKVLDSDKVYEKMDRETADLINEVTGSGMLFEEEEMVNVCIATENMKKKAADARAVEIAKSFLDMGKNTIEEIAKATNLSIDEVKNLAKN